MTNNHKKQFFMKYFRLLTLLLVFAFSLPAAAQKNGSGKVVIANTFQPTQYQHLQWRNIGPYRGGRSVAVAGLPDNPQIYFMGTTGGGLWKTTDAGGSWLNISDGYFRTATIGAIAIAPSDPNIIYVGTGEHAVRGVMTSAGDGMYKSTDGGKTWQPTGLDSSMHIASIAVHPQNSSLVYVAVQGAVHGPSQQRGIYRSEDGGQHWQRLLFINPTTGASDLSMDEHNPRILYAAMWDHLRTPWQVVSGGEGSGLYKSIDGGNSWKKLSKGLPEKMGKTAIDVSPANPAVVYANIEATEGGVFRSADGGDSWEQVSRDRVTIARAWYYTEIVADPANENSVYVLNSPFLHSTDGGRNFRSIPIAHVDQHALWINPHNPDNMILGNDGGGCITFNRGVSWSSQANQPTAQFYRVIADNQFPYHVYGGQQDNSAIGIASRSAGRGISNRDWFDVAGGESAFIAFDPDRPRHIFGTSYQGNIDVMDTETGMVKDIMHYPTVGLAELPKEMKYRFNWNAPLIASPNNPQILYHGAQVVLRSSNGGISWEVISPDLTRNDSSRQVPGGAPYTNEGAGGENYNTLSYLAISAVNGNVLWAGSDDGLLHISRDAGRSWRNITPPDLPESIINCIEASPHYEGTAYVAAMRYKFNDFSPIALVTHDYGQTWTRITRGIAAHAFVRVIREDPARPGLLYAGTERGLYLSDDAGLNWQAFQLNLPLCPITDLTIRNNDLIAATSGRAFWILDDISSLQQILTTASAALVPPRATVLFPYGSPADAPEMGKNPPPGVIIDYYLPAGYDTVAVEISLLDAQNKLIRSYGNARSPLSVSDLPASAPATAKPTILSSRQGFNRTYWDMRREPLPFLSGYFIPTDYRAALMPPGSYRCRLVAGKDTVEQRFQLLQDTRLTNVTPADYQAQQELIIRLEADIRQMQKSLATVRQLRTTLEALLKQLEAAAQSSLSEQGKKLLADLNAWEASVAQVRQKTFQDIINYPNQLNTAYFDLLGRINTHDPRPTAGAQQRYQDISQAWQSAQANLEKLLQTEVSAFNNAYLAAGMSPLWVPATTKE